MFLHKPKIDPKTTHFLTVFPLDSESKGTNCWACSDHPHIDKDRQPLNPEGPLANAWADGLLSFLTRHFYWCVFYWKGHNRARAGLWQTLSTFRLHCACSCVNVSNTTHFEESTKIAFRIGCIWPLLAYVDVGLKWIIKVKTEVIFATI